MPSLRPSFDESRYWEHRLLCVLIRERMPLHDLLLAHATGFRVRLLFRMGFEIHLVPAARTFFKASLIDAARPAGLQPAEFYLRLNELAQDY